MSTQLRAYQQHGKDLVYEQFKLGIKNTICWLQTGGGKSHMFSSMVKDHYDMGIPTVITVRRRELIKQASGHLDRWKVRHGVYMADHRRYRPHEMIQVCSIDTLDARSLYPHSDKERVFRVIDECHDCTPRSKKYSKFMASYPQAYTVGFTATPFSDNSLFQSITCPIQSYELRDLGWLVPEYTYVPNVIDVSNVTIKRTGDFNERELFEASSRSEIVGDFVRDWKKYSQGRPTILFAVNVEHSKIIVRAFNDAGIPAIHSDATTKSRERDRNIKRLIRGQIKILANVNIFSTGVDIPEASCIQLCRPSQSLIWHLQSIGRGLRPAPHIGKQDCIVIDNAGNTLRHGTVYMPREASLKSPRKRGAIGDDVGIRACKQCYFVFDSKIKQCPACGYVNPPVERTIHNVEGELVQYQMSEQELDLTKKRMLFNDFHKLCYIAYRNEKLGDWWIYKKLEEKHGVDLLSQYRDKLEIPEKLRSA